MSLDLRNFINININYNTINISSVERGVVTLITKDTDYAAGALGNKILHSVQEYEALKPNTSLDLFVKAFFANKGKGLQIIGGYTGTGTIPAFIEAVLKELDYHFVIIVSDADEQDLRAAAASSATTSVVTNAVQTNPAIATFAGLNEKMFISSTEDLSGKLYDSVSSSATYEANKYYSYNSTTKQYSLLTSENAPENWPTGYFEEADKTGLNNYIMKVGAKGIEMLAAAFLSQVRVSDASTISDYAFTIEVVKDMFESSVIKDNATGVKLINAHFNFDTELVNEIRNCPGDSVSGADMMNYYVRILLTQDLTEGIMNLLAAKIKYNQTGINRLNNAISQIMNRYINNGYLNTEYIWTGEDLYYEFNSKQYLVCSRNTPLVKGYRCVILPLTSLTNEEKESHVLPPVYVLLADQTGIRAIVINGDVY